MWSEREDALLRLGSVMKELSMNYWR